jgi:hypothetical protein
MTVQTNQLAQSVLLLVLLYTQALWGQGTQYPAFCAKDLAAQQSQATSGAGVAVKDVGKKRKGSSSTTSKSKKSAPIKKRIKKGTTNDQWKQMFTADTERTGDCSNAGVNADATASDGSDSDEGSDTELHPDSNKARAKRCFLEVMKASQVSCYCNTTA